VIASNGTKTDLCFERRFQKDVQVKAFLEQPYACVKWCMDQVALSEEKLRDLIFPSQMTSTESLFQFQYSSSDVVVYRSKTAWTKLLKSFLGDQMKKNKILGVLRVHKNSKHPPGPHESVIQNMDYVLEELKAAEEPFESFVRLPSATV
jgi:hypothetical protein